MKKVFIYLSIVLMGVLICSQNVYADDVTGDATLNEHGHVTLGRVILQDTYGVYYDLTLENSSGLYLVQWSDVLYSVYTVDEMYFNVSGWFYRDASSKSVFNSRTWNNGYSLYEMKAGSFLSTNIPIFKGGDTEAIEAYVNDGDKSGAENSTDFVDEEDGSIPIPHNLRVVSGTSQHVTTTLGDDVIDMYPATFSRDIVITWEQSDVFDGLKYDVDCRISTIHIDDNENMGLVPVTSGYRVNTTSYKPICSEAYNGNKTITLTISKNTMNNYKENGLLKSAQIRLRNKSSGKTSKWVVVTLDFVNKSANASEDGYADGDETPDEDGGEYNDTSVSDDGQLVDKVIDGSSDVSLSGVMSFIRDGFGLLGNGGIIALLSSTFVYLPNSIWIMLKFLVAMMIAVCIIKLVKDVVT